jgi:translation initiation factor IF-2
LAAGIRVNQLAKELGVESRAILQKLRDEGLGDQAPNHMSVLKLGLAASVREWFAHAVGESGGGTAVETAAPVDTAVKTRARPRRKAPAKAEEPLTLEVPHDEQGGAASPEAPTIEEPATRKQRAAPAPAEVPGEAPAAPTDVEEAPPQVHAPAAPAPPIRPAAEAPAAPVMPVTPPPAPIVPPFAAEAPAAAAPVQPAHAPPPHAPAVRAAPQPGFDQHGRPLVRETITLANRPGAGGATIERKPITPAPKLVKPAAAVIQGPRVVREEKPEVVPVPRPRRPMGPGQAGDAPAFQPSRAQTGRGVKPIEDEDEDKKKAAAKSGRTLSNRRRGPDGRRGEAMEKLREFTDADLIERRDRLNAAATYRTGFDTHLRKSEARGTHATAKTGVQRGEPIEIDEPITVKTLSSALGVKSNEIISKLMKQGVFATINQALDTTAAAALALDYGIELQVAQEPTLEEELMHEFAAREPDAESLRPRPPVVTILGHVDHGKTSLLDKIRKANVAAGEAGGITQHTAAWMVTLEGEDGTQKTVTFIDTPGHQAFTSMRARGANMTDVVVLVVAAAEGVQPQTIESINHARAAKVPIVVALNKIDRPDANPDMVLGQLAAQGLNPVEWGGDIEVIRTSAITGQGIKELIEILDYQAELLELKADPTAPARGTVIEARVDPGLGSIATVLVQDGTLHTGDVILAGPGYGRIRSLLNDSGRPVDEAGPATPVIVSGLNELPAAGDKFYVADDFDRARAIAEDRVIRARQQQLAQANRVTTLDNLFDTMKAGDVKTINLIIKADVQGSVETLTKTVTDYNTDEVKIRVIHSAVGGITESDVELAAATKDVNESTVIIGFHVVPDEAARAKAERMHVEIRTYRVIYEIFDDLKKALSGLLEPEVREKLHGHCEIRQVFKVSRVGNIAGCMVTDGHIQRGSKIRLIRDGRVITEDLAIETLRRVKDDVKEVKAGFECGIKLANYDDIKVGDRLEAYVRETFQRTL